MSDVGLLVLILAIIGAGLFVLGLMGDAWDAKERRDARRRNRRG